MASHEYVLDVKGGASTEEYILGETETESATKSLEVSIPLSQSSSLERRDAPLMKDINMLSDILLGIVEREDPIVHALFQEFLDLGKKRYV
jgi:hypothetical protein